MQIIFLDVRRVDSIRRLGLLLAFTSAVQAQPGRLDPTFDPGAGIVASDPFNRRVEAIALQADRKILIAGYFTNVNGQTRHKIARLNAGGSLDDSFVAPAMISGNCLNCTVVWSLAIQADGKIVIGGVFTQIGFSALHYNVSRLNPDGSVDESFNPAGPSAAVRAVAVQSDGKILLGGQFTYASGFPRNRIMRLNPDGTLDHTFYPGAGPNDDVMHVAALPDDTALIAGPFTTIADLTTIGSFDRERIARLNTNGTVDRTYVPAWPRGIGLYAFALAPDLRIVAASSNVYRLNSNGALDASFRNAQRVSGLVDSIVVQTNGKVVLAGPFSSFEGVPKPGILRLNADGNVDTNFISGLGADSPIYCMALQPDGRLLIGGEFSMVDGTSRSGIARLLGGEPPPEAPLIISHPTNQTVDAGQTATFVVGVTGFPPPTFQWLFNEAPIPAATNSTYALINARATNAGSYSVVVSNESGQVVSDSAVLTVFTYPPTITAHPTNLTVDAGQTAAFAVTASGTMPFQYQWLSNAVPMPGRTLRQLSFTAMPERAGSYSVIVSNEAGSVTSDVATLTVLVYPPTITSDPTNLTVVEGRVARFFVSVSAAPPPTYQWFFDGAPIQGRTNAVLSLSNPKPEDSGSYSVAVANSEGSATSGSAVLTVLPAPTTPGSVDVSFVPATIGEGAITRLALQRDGRILIGGSFTGVSNTNRNGFARLDPQGNLDASFAPAGFGSGDVQFLTELPDGRILASKDLGGIVRWNSDGSVDPTFTPPFSFGTPTDILAIQPDGSIVRNFSSQNGYTFIRLTPNGLLDFTFNSLNYTVSGGGAQPPPFTYRFVGSALPDGKIAVGGAGLFRIHKHGATDPDFRAIVSNGQIGGVLARPDGKVFVMGTFTNISGAARRGLALLNPDGSTDLTFNPAGSFLGTILAVALQPDGKLLIGGRTPVARLNVDGSIDTTFNAGPDTSGDVLSILVQPDGKVLLAGSFSEFDGYNRRRIVRLNGDASGRPVISRGPASKSDTEGATVAMHVENTAVPETTYQWTFNGAAMVDETNATLLLRDVPASAAGDYRVIVSNSFGSATSHVATLTVNAAPNTPGLADIEFGAGSGADSTVRAMARQSNGKLIIAGWFNRIHDVPKASVARLNPDGSLDPTFDPGSGPNDRILAVAVDASDRILVGGRFTSFSGQMRNRLARLLPDGELDASFDVGNGAQGGINTFVRSIAVQPDGRIIVGGWFSSFGDLSRYGIARLDIDGSLDPSFAPTQVFIPEIECVAIQPDGRVWAGGRNAIYRFRTNGVSDPSPPLAAPLFGIVRSILIQPDGKILFAGSILGSPGAIWRLNPSGTFDTNFSNNFFTGNFGASIETLRLYTCGRILVGGSFIISPSNPPRFYHVARLNSNGSLDQDFVPKALDGIVFDIAADDGKQVVIAGEFSKVDQAVRHGIARLHAEPFGPPVLFAQPVSQTANGGREVLLSVGITNCSDFTYQWQLNGANIPGGTNAALLLPSVHTSQAGDYRVIIANGPHITISDSAQLQVIPELRHPGSADIDFFPPRNLDGWVHALTLDSNRNLLVGGAFTRIAGAPANRIARFKPTGEWDNSFRAASNLVGTAYALAVQPDGRILTGGRFPIGWPDTNFIERLMPDGRLDTNFNRRHGSGIAYALGVLPDGKFLVAGVLSARSESGGSRSGIARFHPNGNLDTDFLVGGVLYALALAVQTDGKVIIGGTFTDIGQVPNRIHRPYVARVLPSGTPDLTFDPGAGPNSPVVALALSQDERVYIGGNFSEVDGVPRTGIARLNQDGSVDADFNPDPGAGSVFALSLQADGKLLVGGSFRYAGGLSRPGIARFNTDGSIDATFDPGSGANAQVFAIAFDPAGKIYVGGNFTEYNGFLRDRFARINGDMFLLNPSLTAGTFQVSLFTFFGQSYVLEFKNSLADPTWTSLPSILGDGTIKTLTGPTPALPNRYYRVRTDPPLLPGF